MLQTNKLPAPTPVFDRARHYDPGSVVDALQALLGLVRRRWPLCVAAPLILLALGGLYLLVTPPTYLGEATMVIDAGKLHAFQQQGLSTDEPPDAVTVQTQLEVLRSDAIAEAVVKNMQLQNDPEFVPDPQGLTPEQMIQVAVQVFGRKLVVDRILNTYVMDVGFSSLDPVKAARIANATVDAYVNDQLDSKFQATRRASLWLQDRLTELGTEATAAEKAVADYKSSHNIVAADGRLINDQQLSDANSQLAAAKAATAEAKARLDRITEVLNQPVPDASTTEALHNEIIVRLRQQILDLTAREQLFASRYGAKHEATLNIQTQIDGMERSIADEMRKVAEGARSDYAVAKARETALAANVTNSVTASESTNQALVRLQELQSAAQSSRTLYNNFLQRYMDAVQQQTYPTTEARLISPATPPFRRNKPSIIAVLGGALVGGIMLGLGGAMLREVTEGVFRSGDQVERHIALTCLATLPKIKQIKPVNTAKARLAPSGRELVLPSSLYRNVIDEPFSAFAEGLRAVKIAIDLADVSKSHSVIGVTSSLPNEGKSTISANLAQLMAHAGHRVLLVDADLRSPSLSRLFAPGAEGGLVDAVSGKKPLADLIRTDTASQLDFLPAGSASKLPHTNELLRSESMRAFFAAARTHYNYVVVDLAPLAPVVDTRATTQFIDAYLFAVEWGRTKTDVVETVLTDSREVYDATLGVVLTKADLSVLGRYDRHRGNRYHRKFYKRYGYMT